MENIDDHTIAVDGSLKQQDHGPANKEVQQDTHYGETGE